MTFTVRSVDARDVPEVVALVRDTLAEFGLTFGVGSQTDAQLHGLPESYRDRGGEFFVAEERADSGESIIAGCAGVFPLEAGVYELRKMYLRPATRGRGTGARLFDACLDFCRGRGARRVVLDTVEEMTAAIAFYERRGFVRDDAQTRGARCTRGYRLDL
ncbi:MAG TPA: GNAT family N-acetyltransferase [Polyangia bacterium]|nr:GNAT family N-acetyltransferase [Polyangia bacterium]